jgi:hypothetical protein
MPVFSKKKGMWERATISGWERFGANVCRPHFLPLHEVGDLLMIFAKQSKAGPVQTNPAER